MEELLKEKQYLLDRLKYKLLSKEYSLHALAQDLNVSELEDRDYHAISDGQRQRVLLARAICQEPQLMILDEPTSYLDIRHKLEFLDLLKNLVRDRDIGVIMSMHELELAHMVSDRVVCISSEGKIHSSGTPQEVFTDELISRLYGMKTGTLSELYAGFADNLRK